MLTRSVSRIEAKCNFVIRFSTNSEKVFREATISLLKKISTEFREEDLEYGRLSRFVPRGQNRGKLYRYYDRKQERV